MAAKDHENHNQEVPLCVLKKFRLPSRLSVFCPQPHGSNLCKNWLRTQTVSGSCRSVLKTFQPRVVPTATTSLGSAHHRDGAYPSVPPAQQRLGVSSSLGHNVLSWRRPAPEPSSSRRVPLSLSSWIILCPQLLNTNFSRRGPFHALATLVPWGSCSAPVALNAISECSPPLRVQACHAPTPHVYRCNAYLTYRLLQTGLTHPFPMSFCPPVPVSVSGTIGTAAQTSLPHSSPPLPAMCSRCRGELENNVNETEAHLTSLLKTFLGFLFYPIKSEVPGLWALHVRDSGLASSFTAKEDAPVGFWPPLQTSLPPASPFPIIPIKLSFPFLSICNSTLTRVFSAAPNSLRAPSG